MAEISAKLVKQLKDKTNAGIMDCKKALTATNGDIDEAVKWLREKGISDAAKKSDRQTSEGSIACAVSADKKTAALAELRCETDFVARNEGYKAFAEDLALKVLGENESDVAKLSDKYADTVKEAIAKFGENITLGNVAKLSVSKGLVQSYIHGVGNIGVIASFETGKDETASNDSFVAMTMGVAMHIAAMAPEYLNAESVPESFKTENLEVFKNKARESGKPENMLDKIADGMMNKLYAEICALDQAFVKDPKMKISDVVKDAAKRLGDDIKLTGFVRLELGA
jgi:elongation factor Ts